MAREIEFEEWRARPREPGPGVGRPRQPGPQHRPRSREDSDALLQMALERRRLYLACGKLKPIAGGYEYVLGREIIVKWLREHE